jgi:hypothetical protein
MQKIAQQLFITGCLCPLTLRYLSLYKNTAQLEQDSLALMLNSVKSLLNIEEISSANLDEVYLDIFKNFDQFYTAISRSISQLLRDNELDNEIANVLKLIQLDSLLTPIPGSEQTQQYQLAFKASKIVAALEQKQLPHSSLFEGDQSISITTPGGFNSAFFSPLVAKNYQGNIVEAQTKPEMIAIG